MVTKVADLMTEHPVLISPNATLHAAAEKMLAANCGCLPVGTAKHLKGFITDRDIVVRAIAVGKNPSKELVSDHMTAEVFACNEQDSIETAAQKMHAHKISRLVVRNHEGVATGILSFGAIFREDTSAKEVADVIKHSYSPSI